jgi:hypothetical protein
MIAVKVTQRRYVMWKKIQDGMELDDTLEYLTCYQYPDGSFSYPARVHWRPLYGEFFINSTCVKAHIYMEIPEPKIEDL